MYDDLLVCGGPLNDSSSSSNSTPNIMYSSAEFHLTDSFPLKIIGNMRVIMVRKISSKNKPNNRRDIIWPLNNIII